VRGSRGSSRTSLSTRSRIISSDARPARWTVPHLEATYFLVHPESLQAAGAEAEIERLTAFWDSVNREDVDIVERVQRGVSNPAYLGGRMCYRFEEPLHRFQNMIVDRMVGIRRIPEGDAVEQAPMFG